MEIYKYEIITLLKHTKINW